MTQLHYSAIIGFVAVGFYRYVLAPHWNIGAFLKSDLRPMLQAAIVTALAAYFCTDVCAMLPTTIAGLELNPCDALLKAPKLAGFTIGALGSGTDLLAVLKNALQLVPVFGPKIIMVFSRKEAKP